MNFIHAECHPRFFEDDSFLPDGFIYLKDIDPSIIESVRYAGCDNFMGRPVKGYESHKLICTEQMAQALKRVQSELNQQGYKLVVYDTYRPQRAVDNFGEWSLDVTDQTAKNLYYPTINKADVFDLGYIARRSGHSRGSTVDLSIMRLEDELKTITVSSRKLKNGEGIPFLDDGTLDMGASFDLFHEASWHDTDLIDESVLMLRNLLRATMKGQGFKEYSKEWWHYTLIDEPYPDTYFDFVVC